MWRVGPHRLAVGDMLDDDVRDWVLNGQKAALVVTDQPYNVDYTGKTEDKLKIQGDAKDAKQFYAWLVRVWTAMAQMVEKTAARLEAAGVLRSVPAASVAQPDD